MTTSDQRLPQVISFSSKNVERLAKQAWEQVSIVAKGVPEPTIGRASGFLPSDSCFRVMSLEFLGKVGSCVKECCIVSKAIRLLFRCSFGKYQGAEREESSTFPGNLGLAKPSP